MLAARMIEDRMNYERLYQYRFRDVDQGTREAVWKPIALHLWNEMGRPERVLDPAAGRGEFIANIPASERWAVDLVDYHDASAAQGVRWLVSDIFEAELPADHFDGVFVSNFLERVVPLLRPGGRVAILGPNYRYTQRRYWDYADHRLALTHMAVAEHLYAAGLEPTKILPKLLPYSFNGVLPPSVRMTQLYLRLPLAWRLLGKQFLVIGRRPDS